MLTTTQDLDCGTLPGVKKYEQPDITVLNHCTYQICQVPGAKV